MKKNPLIHIGTSGWHYAHWEGPFYPKGISKKDYLKYYTRFFQTVEINNSFYHLPRKETFKNWREMTPANFIFSVKASRYITHVKKLKDSKEPLQNFLKVASGLKEKLGPILFQLPPGWSCNAERLREFLQILPPHYRYTFEFRNSSWFSKEIYEILAKYNIAFCLYELEGQITPRKVTADFIYVRLHGPGKAYQGQYSQKTLKEWAEFFVAFYKQGKDVFCYFDNDEAGYAALDGQRLKDLVLALIGPKGMRKSSKSK